MVVYCHLCGKRLVAGNKKSFTRGVLSAYMTAKHRLPLAEESDHSCRSCAVDIEVWRRVTEPEQYRESEDTVSEASSSSSSVSQASSYASMSTVFSDASTESSRRKRRRSDLLIGQTLPTMFEEEDEEDAEPEQPSFVSERFSHLIERRECLYGCEWTRAADLRILKTDERFALLQDQKIYAATDTYICKSHENSEFDDERVISADFLTRRFTVKEFEDALSLSLSASVARPFRDGVPVPDKRCKRWTGLTYGDFSSLCSDVTLRRSRKKMLPIAVYLAKLRTGDSLERIADTFCISLSSARNYDKLAREALLEHFVPRNLGFQHLDRETTLSHVTNVSKALFNVEDDDADKMICVADGTYIYHQKSFHHSFQRESYSPHKYRHLFKPMMIVAPDGYILDVKGPYAAKSNDASIFEDIIRAQDFSEFFTRGDIFILDRGFRSCLQSIQNKGYRYRTPEFSAPNQQLSCQAANRSRIVTKVRWVVEDVNGKIKSKYRAFDKVWPNTALDHAFDDFRVVCAILNKFGKRFQTDHDAVRLAQEMVIRSRKPNLLIELVEGFERWNSRTWQTIDVETLRDFPKYDKRDLLMFTLGPYQLKMAEGYYLEHSSPDGRFRIQVQRDPTQLTEKAEIFDMDDPVLIRARIQSRHSNATKYIVLLCYDTKNPRKLLHYCQCKSGARTVGCCAHTATLVWYLGWARNQDDFHVPSLPMEILDTHDWTDEDE